MSSTSRWRIGAQRDRAERYLVITIAAFAITVAGVRWYLDVAGYPTVGGGGLHVAHVLWGGLGLFIAAVLPLLYVGQRSLLLSALFAGIGAGLFIDEVGKFLTTSNNYFFAPAAPIIYGSILLLVLLALLVRRRGVDRNDVTHAVIEALGEGADGRLTKEDRERALGLVQTADVSPDAKPDELQALLVAALESPAIDAGLAQAGPVARGDARRMLERLLPTRLERWLVILGLIGGLLTAAGGALLLVLAALEPELADFSLDDSGRMEIPTDHFWLFLMLGVNVVSGTVAAAALVFLARGRRARGLDLALVSALITLVVGGLVSFYAIQFAALSSSVWGLLELGLIIDQRIRHANAIADTAVDATDD